jgi:hypothetical protein
VGAAGLRPFQSRGPARVAHIVEQRGRCAEAVHRVALGSGDAIEDRLVGGGDERRGVAQRRAVQEHGVDRAGGDA